MSAPGTNKVDYEVRADGVAVVTLDHFPLNTLSNAVMLGIEAAAEQIARDARVKAVVVRGAGDKAFCAGADVVDLNKTHARSPKRNFTEYFEALSVPVVAAIQGFALGGGMELSLSCHYRVIGATGAMGLPEVNIGLLPGGEGTQRLPRVVGAKAALNLMLSGAHVPAAQAAKLKLVDAVVDPSKLLDEACSLALRMARENPSNAGRRLSELPCAMPTEGAALFVAARKEQAGKRRGQPAAQRIIDCVEAACTAGSFREGLAVEQRLFKQLLGSPEANALQHVFFAERAAAKVPGLSAQPAKVRSVGIVGSGLMAGGIAMNFIEKGIKTVLLDREERFLAQGVAVIKQNYARSVQRGSKTQAAVDKALALLSTTTQYVAFADVDLVIEAVFEDMPLKKEIFAQLDQHCKPGAVLASNTSFLSIDEIAGATRRPEDVIGCHFFSPANVMPLLENVRGRKSSARTIATAQDVGSRIGKWPVLVGNCHGFVANRMMANYGVEARNMLMTASVSYAAIDAVAQGKMGMPMGPFAMSDLTGLAIGVEVRKRNGTFDPERQVQDWLLEQGRQGMKNSKGWYDYAKDMKRTPSDLVAQRVVETRNKLAAGKPLRNLSDGDVFLRLCLPVINEGFRILEEGIASRPADIDVVLVHGYNWPRVTGGPMHQADAMGLATVLAGLERFSKENPKAAYFQPAQLLVDCVRAKQTLAQYWAKNAAKYTAKL